MIDFSDAWDRLRRHCPGRAAIAFAFCIVTGVFLFAFVPYSEGYGSERVSLFRQFLNISGQGEDWQHCVFVPILVLGLGIQTLLKQPLAPIRVSYVGLAGVIASLILYYLGFRMSLHYVGFFAIQGLLFSAIWFSLGTAVARQFIFPLTFLVFAWPLPFLDTVVAFPLRILMSNGSAAVLNGLGIDVVRQGTGILSAPDPMLGIPAGKTFSVDVADPCSGIRSLFALMMIGALYGHFTQRRIWQKWVIFLSAVPLAVLGNLTRILILTLGTIIFGAKFAIGENALTDPSWFHMAAGYAVFGVALGGMIAIGGLMSDGWRWGGAISREWKQLHRPKAPKPAPPGPREDIY